jgi:hypothetical protein
MPGGDRTGPLGEGPMTGRGMGYCAGADSRGYFDARGGWGGGRRYGSGFGRGGGRIGRGRGFGNRFARPGWGQRLDDVPRGAGAETEELRAMVVELSKRLDSLQEQISGSGDQSEKAE